MAVVLLHPTKALAAAWMAVFVSVSPISGIFPSTSLVAGSGEPKKGPSAVHTADPRYRLVTTKVSPLFASSQAPSMKAWNLIRVESFKPN